MYGKHLFMRTHAATGTRRPGLAVVMLAAAVAIASLAACANPVSTDTGAPPTTTPAKAVIARNKILQARRGNAVVSPQVKAQNRARLVAAIRLRWQQHAVLVRAAQRRQRIANQARQTVRVFVTSPIATYSTFDVCAGVGNRRA